MINIDILMNEIIFPKSRAFIPERWINDPNLIATSLALARAHGLAWALSDFPNLHIYIPYLTNDYSLAQAELYITLATVFSWFTFELYRCGDGFAAKNVCDCSRLGTVAGVLR